MRGPQFRDIPNKFVTRCMTDKILKSLLFLDQSHHGPWLQVNLFLQVRVYSSLGLPHHACKSILCRTVFLSRLPFFRIVRPSFCSFLARASFVLALLAITAAMQSQPKEQSCAVFALLTTAKILGVLLALYCFLFGLAPSTANDLLSSHGSTMSD